jgi:hypothetical protein
MEGLDKGGQGPISGCCAIEEEDDILLYCYLIFVDLFAVCLIIY